MSSAAEDADTIHSTPADRRTFLSTASSVAMAGGLLAGYGTLGVLAAQFLYPTKQILFNFVEFFSAHSPYHILFDLSNGFIQAFKQGFFFVNCAHD